MKKRKWKKNETIIRAPSTTNIDTPHSKVPYYVTDHKLATIFTPYVYILLYNMIINKGRNSFALDELDTHTNGMPVSEIAKEVNLLIEMDVLNVTLNGDEPPSYSLNMSFFEE